ncbi:MAG TPA: response regulator [Myxococcota bacterium]|nr:response regulator [Myxococcota bacterium]
MTKRILAVDDEQVVLGAICKALGRDELEIDTAREADSALKLLTQHNYDLLITDLMMPKINGLELLDRLSNMQIDTRVIMITGYPAIRTALQAKRLGAFEYVSKPFTRQELRSVVIRALRSAPESQSRHISNPIASGSRYAIPHHSWAKWHSKDIWRAGMMSTFAAEVGSTRSLQPPCVGSLVEQGRIAVVIEDIEGVEHFLHAPLSGKVIEVNPSLEQDSSLAGAEPEGRGWLFSLAPVDLKKELSNLVPC